MRKAVWIITVLWLSASGGIGYAVDMRVQTGFNFNRWYSDHDSRGMQTFVPVTIYAEHADFSAKVLTSFAHTQSDLFGAGSNSLACVLDTKLNVTYAIIDKFFADCLLGFDVNLPTGRTELDTKELQLAMDPDLVAITQFGEGLNFNPTFTLAKAWHNWAAGFGVGYLWRGEYDYSEIVHNYDPGEILSITGEIAYSFSSQWQCRLFGEFALYDNDEVDDEKYYEEGNFSLIGFGVLYTRDDWNLALTVESVFRGKSAFQEAGEGLKTEDRSSYGDEWSIDLTWRYNFSKETLLRSQIYYLFVEENDYGPDSPFYIGEKEKISFLVALMTQLTPSLRGEFSLSGYTMDVDRNWFYAENRNFDGFIIGVSVTQSF